MKILELVAENFKKIRVVEITPTGNLVQITGRNGQGKTSVLDSIQFALQGKKALPDKAVRKGATKMTVKLKTTQFTVERSKTTDGLPTLTIEMAKGFTREGTPQEFLDTITEEITFDPLEFVGMDRKAQVAILQRVAKIDLDSEAMAAANKKDYDERTAINKDIKQLEAELRAINVLDGLPKEKVDEAGILARMNEAGERNRAALGSFRAKQELGAQVGIARAAVERNEVFLKAQAAKIEELKRQVELAVQALKAGLTDGKRLERELQAAEETFKAAPEGELVDVAALSQELQAAQRTNRAIDTRAQWDAMNARLEAKRREAQTLTRQMDAREEKKRVVLSEAKMPVDGLSFDETQVLWKGLPLENLGEGEQIRISAQIAMAANPKLRIMFVKHGEALDEDGLKVLADLATEHDYQVWMARVDSSGKVGIVIEDGMVVARNEEGA